MNNKIIREINKEGRITLKADLLELCGIKKKTKVAICKFEEDKICIRRLDSIKNYKVIACVSVDEKYHLIIPAEIRKQIAADTKFEMYYLDGSLILEEAH